MFYGYVDVSILKSFVRNVDAFKQIINQKSNNDVTNSDLDIMTSIFFEVVLSLVKFSSWSKFHANIITGSGVTTIFDYKRLTRSPEIVQKSTSEFWRFAED